MSHHHHRHHHHRYHQHHIIIIIILPDSQAFSSPVLYQSLFSLLLCYSRPACLPVSLPFFQPVCLSVSQDGRCEKDAAHTLSKDDLGKSLMI